MRAVSNPAFLLAPTQAPPLVNEPKPQFGLRSLISAQTACHQPVVPPPAHVVASSAPINCKHGMRTEWCAYCKEHRDYLAPKMPVEAERATSSETQAPQTKTSLFTRCLHCGKKFDAPKNVEFCGEVLDGRVYKSSACRAAWLDKYVPLCVIPSSSNFHQVTPEDVEWGKRQGSKRERSIDSRSKIDCPLCDEKKVLEEGCYICDSHSKTYGELLKNRVAPINHPINAVRYVELRNAVPTKEQKLLEMCASVSLSMPDSVDVYYTIEPMPYKHALRYLTACKRWLMEKKMVKDRHPEAPYEARSLDEIVSESRLFPN